MTDKKRLLGCVETIQLILGVTDKYYNTVRPLTGCPFTTWIASRIVMTSYCQKLINSRTSNQLIELRETKSEAINAVVRFTWLKSPIKRRDFQILSEEHKVLDP